MPRGVGGTGQYWLVLPQTSQLFLCHPCIIDPYCTLYKEVLFQRDQGIDLPQNDLEIYLIKVDLSEISVVCSPGWRTRTDPRAARSRLRHGHFAQRNPEAGRAEKTSQTANEAAGFKSGPCSSGITFPLRDIWVTVSAFRNCLSGSDLTWCCGQNACAFFTFEGRKPFKNTLDRLKREGTSNCKAVSEEDPSDFRSFGVSGRIGWMCWEFFYFFRNIEGFSSLVI